MTNAMREVDRQYRAASGLDDRRFYKIFYSHIHPFPLLVLGQNPGGETDGTDLSASESFFENWEHDYAFFRNDSRYALAGPMCRFLAEVLQTRSVDVIRQVPATNVVFRRSRNTDTLNVRLSAAAEEARPFLDQILRIVDPRCVLLVSNEAYKQFTRLYCRRGTVVPGDDAKIFTPNGRNPACIFTRSQGFVEVLGRIVPMLVVGHPSKYSARIEWRAAAGAVRRDLEELGISPIENISALVQIPPLPCYGTTLE